MAYPWYKEKKKQDSKVNYYWTDEEASRLKLLRYQGYSIPEIAKQMGRSESSIKYKLYVYGRRK
jgi:transposase